MANPDAAALALLDRITPGPWELWGEAAPSQTVAATGGPLVMQTVGGNDEANARAIAALPEFAALYRAGVELQHHLRKSLDAGPYTNNPTRESQRFREFHAALAAVADKLTGEGK